MQKFSISIDLAKVDKLKLTKTEKGQIFGNFDLIIRDDVDQYGNIGFIVQKQSKEEREQQIKLPILGNAKKIEIKQQSPAPAPEHKSDFKPLPSEVKKVDEYYKHTGTKQEWEQIKEDQNKLPF